MIELGIDINKQTSEGLPIDIAITFCKKSEIELLIESGADITHLYGKVNTFVYKGNGWMGGMGSRMMVRRYFEEKGIVIEYEDRRF